MPTTSSIGVVTSEAATPCGALFLVAPSGQPGLLMRVGQLFGWAGGGTVLIDSVEGPQWNALVHQLASTSGPTECAGRSNDAKGT